MNNQPTILVKKADGTSVRMTMDELQKYKNSQTVSNIASPNVQVAPVKLVPTPTPAPESPISYKLKAKTSFVRPVPPAEEKKFVEKWESEDNKSLLDDSLEKEKLPAVKSNASYMPTAQTPVKDIFVDEAKYKLKFDTPRIKPAELVPKKPAEPVYVPQAIQIPQIRQVIQDVKPPQTVKQSVGPVDELENFSLADFRRLEVNTKAAGLKLIDKFETLKHDSYLLFMDGVKAWYNSPLYRQYQDVLYQSLARNKSVSEILTGGNIQKDLKLEEFKTILEVNEAVN